MRARDSDFNAACQTVLEPSLPPVPAIRADISRVLINIFSNAFYSVRQKQKRDGGGYAPTVTIRPPAVPPSPQVPPTMHRYG